MLTLLIPKEYWWVAPSQLIKLLGMSLILYFWSKRGKSKSGFKLCYNFIVPPGMTFHKIDQWWLRYCICVALQVMTCISWWNTNITIADEIWSQHWLESECQEWDTLLSESELCVRNIALICWNKVGRILTIFLHCK